MTLVIRRDLPRPVRADVYAVPRLPPLEEQEEEVVDDGAEAEQLAGPYAAAVVALQAVDEGEIPLAAAVVAARVEAVELVLADGAGDAVVDALGAERDVGPRVHLADLVVELLGADAAGAHGGDGLARRGDEVLLLGLGEGGHVGGQHLGDAADLGADDVEAAAGGLDDDGAEGLGQRRVEVDVAAGHDVADVLVADGAQHLDVVLQDVGLDHLLEVDGLGARARDDEARVRVVLEDARDHGREQVRALVVEEARDDDDGDHVARAERLPDGGRVRAEATPSPGAPGRVQVGRRAAVVAGPEVLRHDGVGYDRHHQGVQRRAQHRVLLARVAHAYAVVHVAQAELEQLVRQDARRVREPEQRVVGEDGAQAHGPRVQDGLVAEVAQAGVAVDDLDALADADVAEEREEGEDGREGGLAVDDEEGHVVDLEAVGQVAHALAVVVGVRDDDDLVAAVDELAGELVDVRLDAAGLREEEVADHGDVVRPAARHRGRFVLGGLGDGVSLGE